MALRFLSDVQATAGTKDSSGDLGSNGQVLSSTGSDTNWVNPTVGTTVIYKDAFTATNGQTAFTLANTVDSEDKTQVYIDGAYQSKGGYTVSGTTLTFDTGLETSSEVEVMTFSTATANNAASAVKLDTFTGDGSNLTFDLSEAVVDEKVTQVYINGVYQNKSTYSIDSNLVTLRFGTGNAPPTSSAIEVISFKTITSTDGTLTATTFLGDLNGTINTATTATTQSAGNNSTKISTTAYTDAKVAEAITNGTTGIAPSQDVVFDALALKSNIAGPTFTGTPAAPTASAGTNTTQLATTAFVNTGIANIVDSAPGTLNTLNELAAALGDDVNFSTTVTDSIATKLPLAGGTLTGAILIQQSGSTGFTTEKTGGTGSFINLKDNAGSVFIGGVNSEFVVQTPGSSYSNKLTISSGGDATFSGAVTSKDLNVVDAYANDPLIKLAANTSGNAEVQIRTATTSYNPGIGVVTSGFDFNLFTNNTPRLTISSGGITSLLTNQEKTSESNVEYALLGRTNESNNYSALQLLQKGGASNSVRNWSLQTIEAGVANAGNIILQPSGGLVGIGRSTLSSSSRLTLYESTGNGQTLEIIGANSGGVGSQPGIKFTGNSAQNIGGIYADTSSENINLQTGGTTRLTISSGGIVQINGSSVGTLMFQDVTNGASMFYLQNATYVGSAPYNDNKIIAANSSNISFEAGGGTRMRITSGGDIFMGGISADPSHTVFGSAFVADSAGRMVLKQSLNRSTVGAIQEYYSTSGAAGQILVTGNTTNFSGTSDYRLKENVTPITDALSRVNQLKPSRFNFIADTNTIIDGFLAHEVQDIVPIAVSGEKDAVNEDGTPNYQGIDQSKIVPLLTAAIQEQQTIIEDLKSRIETLEG